MRSDWILILLSSWLHLLIDLVDGQSLISTYMGHAMPVTSTFVSSGFLYAGSIDYTIKQYNATSNIYLRTYSGHSASVVSIFVSGNSLFSASVDGTIKLWDTTSGLFIKTFVGSPSSAIPIYVSGNFLYSGASDNSIKQWDINTAAIVNSFVGHTGAIRALAISPRSFLISGSSDKSIIKWNLNTGALIATMTGHTDAVSSLSISGGFLFSGSMDTTIRQWNLTTSALIKSFPSQMASITCIATGYGYVFAGTSDNKIVQWNVGAATQVQSFVGHTNSIASVSVSGSLLFSGAGDSTVKKWNIYTGATTFVGATEVDLLAKSYGKVNLNSNYILALTYRVKFMPGSTIGSILSFSNMTLGGPILPSMRIFVNASSQAPNILIPCLTDPMWTMIGTDIRNLGIGSQAQAAIKLKVSGLYVTLFYDNLVIAAGILPSDPITGVSTFWMSDQNYNPAQGYISYASLTPYIPEPIMYADPVLNLVWEEKPIIRGTYFGRVDVPANYILSLTLKVMSAPSRWGSVMHFTNSTKNNQPPNSRMPSLWINQSLIFSAQLDSISGKAMWINSSTPLTLYTPVDISLRVNQGVMRLLFNSVVVPLGPASYSYVGEPTFSGPADLYVGDYWHNPFSGTISKSQIRAYESEPIQQIGAGLTVIGPLEVPIRRGYYLGRIAFTSQWEFGFAIKPLDSLGGQIFQLSPTELSATTVLAVGMTTVGVLTVKLPTTTLLTPSIRPIPLNLIANVIIRAQDNRLMVLVNGAVVIAVAYPNTGRYQDTAYAYLCDPLSPALNALVSNVKLSVPSGETIYPMTATISLFQTSVQLTRGTYFGKRTIPTDYKVTLSIKPPTILSKTGEQNILLFTTADQSDDGLWIGFMGTTGQITVRVDNPAKDGTFASIVSRIVVAGFLQSTVSVQLTDSFLRLWINGVLSDAIVIPFLKPTGVMDIYASAPHVLPADIMISQLDIVAVPSEPTLPTDSVLILVADEMAIPKTIYTGRANVAKDYRISLTLRPIAATSINFTNIFHFSKTSTSCCTFGTGMPALYFRPDSLGLTLYVETLTNTKTIDTGELPINVPTQITIKAFGRIVQIFYNYTLVGATVLDNDRTVGPAYTFVSHAQSLPGNAFISNLSIVKMSREPTIPLEGPMVLFVST